MNKELKHMLEKVEYEATMGKMISLLNLITLSRLARKEEAKETDKSCYIVGLILCLVLTLIHLGSEVKYDLKML